MAKQSIIFPDADEHRDTVTAIIVILGILALFYQPLTVVCGAAIIAVPFIIVWFWNRM